MIMVASSPMCGTQGWLTQPLNIVRPSTDTSCLSHSVYNFQCAYFVSIFVAFLKFLIINQNISYNQEKNLISLQKIKVKKYNV